MRLALEVLEDRLAPATLTVNTLGDEALGDNSLTLRDAITVVNNGTESGLGLSVAEQAQISGTLGTNDTIQFSIGLNGTITLTSGELLISQNVTIGGPGASTLAVSGNDATRVFEVTSGTSVILSGLTIRDGYVSGDNGAGILIDGGGTLTVLDSTLSGNTATSSQDANGNFDIGGSGGGIDNEGTLTVSNSILFGNSAASGAGIYNSGAGILSNQGTLTVSNSTFSGNSATYDGGGIDNIQLATVMACTFSDNSAQLGGGIANKDQALLFNGMGNYTVLSGMATLTVDSSTLADNSAGDGGGIYWEVVSVGLLAVTNSTLTDNCAANSGGGICYLAPRSLSFGFAELISDTIADNRCNTSNAGPDFAHGGMQNTGNGQGGGIAAPLDYQEFGFGTFLMYNTIVADNFNGPSPSSTADDTAGYGDIVGTNNLIGTGDSGWLYGLSMEPGYDNQVGVADPGLAPLGDYGGPTQTMALLPGSLAIQAGGNGPGFDIYANPLNNLTTDQRGAPADSPTPDIGDFQSQGFNVTADITDPTYSSGQVGLALSAVDGPGGNQAAGFIYNIDWGDGTAQNPDTASVPASAGNGSGVALSHDYANPGVYTVSLTATDEGLEVSPPVTAIVVISTMASDQIGISGGSSPGQVAIATTDEGCLSTTATPAQVLVAGSGGNDAYTVNFGNNLTAPLTIAGSGTDTITVNGSTDPSTSNYIAKTTGSQSTITWGPSSGPPVETVAYTGIQTTNVYGGAGTNDITDPGSQTNIYGGPGQNTIVITAATGSGVAIHGGGSDSYVVDLGNLAGPVTISNSHTGAIDTLTVNGAPGNNTMSVAGSQITERTQTITVSAPLASLTVNGGSGNNQITVSALSVPVQNLAINGGGTGNSITLNNIGTSVAAVAVTAGSGSGTNLVQVLGSLPATVTAQNVLPVVNAGTNATVNDGSTFSSSGSFADSSATGTFSATVNYGDGTAVQPLGLSANKTFSLSHVYGKGGTDTVTVTVNDGHNGVGTGSFVVTVLNVPPSVGAISGTAQVVPGQTVALTANFTDPGFLETHTATFNWGDNTTSAGTVTESNGSGSVAGSHVYATSGTYTVTLTVTDSEGASSTPVTFKESVTQSDILLDATAGGALTISGNGSINIPGMLVVDSSSTSALSASGNATVKAGSIQVAGKVQKSGNATISPAPVTGAAAEADPLANLAGPSTTGLTNYGAATVSGNSSQTLSPGIFTQITISGNATVTFNPGLYLIEGGGFTVSGNATVKGTGVLIYNAGSSYPNTGGTYGAISLTGNGAINLTAPATGAYAGLVFVQPSANAKALTMSGNAVTLSGTVFAPAAQLDLSGDALLNAAMIVDTLVVSGNGVSNGLATAAPAGTVAYTPAQIRAAYGISSLALDGTGRTIAIVDAYDDPSIYPALDAFDSQFGLTASGPTLYAQYGPASSFLTVLNQNGQATSLPGTDPNGPGTDNWEVEESLDVEWAHATAPGAQIILVEANSQSLSDLMASVATAAGQPGVSVVSMSWGFAEGQAVFASDEATYDRVFNVPGVTFVASTGDYGAADPEYPAYSPNVVAVGGSSLTLNGDGSYNSETGWGYYSDSVGAFIGSGGGISLYEPEPAYQLGVQSTGSRTTPDVSLVADPATGAWIADPYNLDPSNPFEIVGGTSLSAPAWAGLLALVNQGRAAAGEPTLNSSSPTDTQQALYILPQSDYNAIAGGSNGYSAGAGYNLVTGLGTPVANRLVPDLVAYQGPGTSYAGPTVAGLQNAGLVNTGTNGGGPENVFSVFDSVTVTSNALGDPQGQVPSTDLRSALYETMAPGGTGRTSTSPLIAAESPFGPASNLSPAGLMPLPLAGITITPVATGFILQQPAWSTAQPVVTAPASSEQVVLRQRTDHDNESGPFSTRLRTGLVPDSVLNELASEPEVRGAWSVERGAWSVERGA